MTIPSRVTEGSMGTRALGDLQRAMSRTQKLQGQISGGKQLTRPSDSPTGTVTSLQLRSEVRATQQYARNADDGLGWLGTIQDTLGAASGSIIRVRDLTLQALNNANTDASRDALAMEIDQIRETLLGQANTKYMNRPVFGGTTPGAQAYDSTGTWAGNENPTTRTVGPNAKVRIEITGPEVFGTPTIRSTPPDPSDPPNPAELFTVLGELSRAIKDNDHSGLEAGLKNLDSAHELLKSALSDVGARYNRIEQMKQSADDHLLSVSSQLSDIEDVDLPKAIMELQIQQTSYQAALAATAKVIQPSLIDFLR
jgi:flagellar hook-associated protein 3 FlgL